MKLGFVIGYGGSMIRTLGKVLEELREEYGIEYEIFPTNSQLEIKEEDLISCDSLLVYTSKDLYDEAISKASMRGAKVFGIDSSHLYLSNVSLEDLDLAGRYWRLGGKENLRALCLLMLKTLGEEVEVPPPEEIPWEGIFHPDHGCFDSTEEYLKSYPKRDLPLVGILFYRNDYVYGRISILRALIEEIESIGLGVLPVFTYGFKDEKLRIRGTSYAIQKYFLSKNAPRIELLVNLTSFFVVDHGKSIKWAKEGFREVEEVSILKDLGVPIIQPVIMHYHSVEEWKEDPRGISPLSLVYRVSMPEVDGAIEPIVISGTRIGEFGEKEYEVIRDQVRYLATRILKWIELRRKPPEKRRIAIVLINPPCKNLEANVAVGLGLDVPESVVRFLRKLKNLGYKVERIPSSGEELIQEILRRKAISEFRWTPVEEIVEKGGALALVSKEKYLKWFEELPKRAKEEMRRSWGDPEEVLSGRRKDLAGMVYKGHFVIPGISFGNVIVLPQPKRGCAGAKCDGTVCKILHDPKVPPPHQWLAVYRWISEEFKADLVIHFGTHGYLEFLPGKGVGLSPECWPQISLWDLPHVYVYVVSNPMEGTIAKRRGYAAILDHIYPPMSMGKGMEKLEKLLEEYERAKRTGSEERRKEIMRRIEEIAKKEGFSSSGEELIEEIHRKLHLVQETQINLGLHVLGAPPEGKKLAEYVVTLMANDTYSFPSLRRILSNLIGINYEEAIRNPEKRNEEFGISNSILMRKVHESCVRIVEKLLKLKNPREEEIRKAILEEVERWRRQLRRS